MPQSNETDRPSGIPSNNQQPASGAEIRSVTTSAAYVRAGERALARLCENQRVVRASSCGAKPSRK